MSLEYPKKQGYIVNEPYGIPDFARVKVLIVGDIMLDKYYQGTTDRISPEAPVPIVNVKNTTERPGGAANVAVNAAMLGASVTLLGYVGKDNASKSISNALSALNVDCKFISVDELSTITKMRVLSRNQQLLRLDFEQSFSEIDSGSLIKLFEESIKGADVVVFSDYAKGTLSCIESLIKIARASQKPVIIDPKGSDFDKYAGATVVTPNLSEFNIVNGASTSEAELQQKAERLCLKNNISSVLLTRSEQGMSLYTLKESTSCNNDMSSAVKALHLPAKAREVFDVTGAGDTVVSTLACSLAAGLDIEHASQLANYAAGEVVGKIGTSSVTSTELALALSKNQELNKGILNQEQLLQAVKQAQSMGETVVMTNGCFDILHSGHVSYLKQASKLGDKLIVAVNSDNTVEKLKGLGRPINSVVRRMAVLAGLSSVDWVVEFTEDTPERLISELLPNVLVKGGDYTIEQIAGGKQVAENGGQVLALDFEEGVSTSAIISQIVDPQIKQ